MLNNEFKVRLKAIRQFEVLFTYFIKKKEVANQNLIKS